MRCLRIQRLIGERAHHVDRDVAIGAGDLARCADLAVERLEVGGAVRCRVAALAEALHDVRVEAAQVDAGERADRAGTGYGPGEAVARDAHAHAALDDGQQLAPADVEQWKRGVDHWRSMLLTVQG